MEDQQQNEELRKKAEIEKEERIRAEARAKAEEEIKTKKAKEKQKKTRKVWLITLGMIVFVVIITSLGGNNKQTSQSPQQKTQGYPSFSQETMDRDCILSCAGGDEVVLWDKPTDAAGGARFRNRVPCGTFGWAFNKYYNEELNVTFYAINTNDTRVKNAYGWITEDLITWRE